MGFNALEFFPGQPDEMGVWPKGVVRPWEETPVTPDGPDVLEAVMLSKGMAEKAGNGFVELIVGFCLTFGDAYLLMRAENWHACYSLLAIQNGQENPHDRINRRDNSFHAGETSDLVPEKSRKPICMEFLVGKGVFVSEWVERRYQRNMGVSIIFISIDRTEKLTIHIFFTDPRSPTRCETAIRCDRCKLSQILLQCSKDGFTTSKVVSMALLNDSFCFQYE